MDLQDGRGGGAAAGGLVLQAAAGHEVVAGLPLPQWSLLPHAGTPKDWPPW